MILGHLVKLDLIPYSRLDFVPTIAVTKDFQESYWVMSRHTKSTVGLVSGLKWM